MRFKSLDVFRGATVALMILVNNPGSWDHIFSPLDHAEWAGCTPTDLVFPFFLFAVGTALAFVMPKLEEKHIFWQKVVTRSLLIFLIGLFISWFPFIKWSGDHIVFKPWAFTNQQKLPDGSVLGFEDGVRIMGVLQRIALCYFFAAVIIHFFKVRGSFVVAMVLLIGYWGLCILGSPDDPYSMTGYFGRNVDISILGKSHMLHGDKVNGIIYHFDYEGLASSFAAISQVLLGYIAGDYISKKGKTPEMLNGVFVVGVILTACGMMWGMQFPIVKKIWTSSYTIYTTGLALLILGVMMYLIEFKSREGWLSRFFDVFGKNALFIFMLSGLLPRAMGLIRIPNGVNDAGDPKYLTPLSWFYENCCKWILPRDPRIGSVIYAFCFIAFMWFLAWLLDKKKIYIKV